PKLNSVSPSGGVSCVSPKLCRQRRGGVTGSFSLSYWPARAARTGRSKRTFPVATSRNASTGGLSFASISGRAPAMSCRARLVASRTSAKRLSTSGRQSSTVTRAMDYSLRDPGPGWICELGRDLKEKRGRQHASVPPEVPSQAPNRRGEDHLEGSCLLACGGGGGASNASFTVQGQSSTVDFSTRTSLSKPSASA